MIKIDWESKRAYTRITGGVFRKWGPQTLAALKAGFADQFILSLPGFGYTTKPSNENRRISGICRGELEWTDVQGENVLGRNIDRYELIQEWGIERFIRDLKVIRPGTFEHRDKFQTTFYAPSLTFEYKNYKYGGVPLTMKVTPARARKYTCYTSDISQFKALWRRNSSPSRLEISIESSDLHDLDTIKKVEQHVKEQSRKLSVIGGFVDGCVEKLEEII